MSEISYVGETLWIGYVSRLLIITGFVSALMAALAYLMSVRTQSDHNKSDAWSKLGHLGFWAHGFSVIALISLIFYSMITRRYEYNYVFEHVSDDLPLRYILSAFWEGQEGSFMLWMFWHIVLGGIIWFTDKKWRVPVLSVFMLVEVCLSSMLLGIYLPFTAEEFKIGSNPMVLIRENLEAPIFSNAQYLSLIKGRGLNPLLQNYWNTIHPPMLFLGFASTLAPFAYALSGLMLKEHKEWLKPGFRWALFSGGALGVGITMGALWAYEALSFGGYWAWDPVENSSLVPWIIMIAGIHTNLIANNVNKGLKSTYLFYILSFLFILYSTLLTRSGILGDTSAHAFTEMGLEWQLTFFLLLFLVSSLVLFFFRLKSIPDNNSEESMWSREFWLYVGSLVLAFSAILIIAATSLPVFNTIIKYFNPSYVGMVLQDPIEHYNRYQLWIGVFIGLLSGFTIFLRYHLGKLTKSFMTSQAIYLAIAGMFTFLISRWVSLPQWQYVLLTFSAAYVATANIDYLIRMGSKNIKLGAAAFSHLGFGLMLIGLVASGKNSYHLNNPFLFRGMSDEEGFEEKYIQLIKGKPLLVRGHMVTYESDTLIDRERFYTLDFKKIDKDLNVLDSFKLRPNAMYSNDFAKIAAFNPDTRHYIGKDIFTCVVNLPPHLTDAELLRQMEDSIVYETIDVTLGDTLEYNGLKFVFSDPKFESDIPEVQKTDHDFAIEIPYQMIDQKGEVINQGASAISMKGSLVYKFPEKIESEAMRIRPSENTIDQLITPENELEYETFELKNGEKFSFAGHEIELTGFDRDIKNEAYESEEGDLAIAAILTVNTPKGGEELKPIYIIRGNRPFGLKDYSSDLRLHARLISINPADETFTVKMAKDKAPSQVISMELAKDVPRSDYLILEAKVFPGINFLWVGCSLMMFGLLMAWYFKLKERKI